jgi:hypothetical protein
VPLDVRVLSFTEAEPITLGLPFPKGALPEDQALRLCDHAGRPVPLQTQPLARWADGSVKWLLLDFLLRAVPAECHRWTLNATELPRPPVPPLTVEERAEAVVVNTGAAIFHVDRRVLRPLLKATGEGLALPQPLSSVELAGLGRRRHGRTAGGPRVEDSVVEQRGPVRATVCLRGRWPGRPVCRFVARLDFFAGTGLVRFRLTLHNPDRARHQGGLWDSGDPRSVYFDSLSLCLRTPGFNRLACWAEPGAEMVDSAASLSLLQQSSGGDNWQSRIHLAPEGLVAPVSRGFLLRQDGRERPGLRANPVVALLGERSAVTVAAPEFWQQFPRGLSVEGGRLAMDFFPALPGARYELQGGEQKTHTVWLDFGPLPVGQRLSLDWVHHPALVAAAPEWYAASGAFFLFAGPDAVRPGSPCATLLEEALDGADGFFAKREIIDEYGWRHFGELYADHENEHYTGPKPIVSHYNNQYDPVNGLLMQWLRTGERRWWELADPLARHVIDIDIYHTDRDRPAYNGGMFWHTDHYRDAASAGHRAYSRANRPPGRPYGGGPGNEHNWSTGLLHYHYLTGDPEAREAVLGLADWVLRRDDGRLTFLGLIDEGPTGLASRTGGDLFHGPGRGGGNSINALLDAWLLSGERRYLDGAEGLIRRCVHPGDDLAAMDLTNPEHRWSYTVFLSVLARYLDLKRAADQVDESFAYARAVLLHYGEWLAEHERPYFDQAEKLDFANETWAAQEMRKANVLRLAARHEAGPAREKMRRRGDELAERTWHDVFRFPTRTSTRSLAILLTEGPRDGYLRGHPDEVVAEKGTAVAFGAPSCFVPQRQRVKAQLKRVAGLLRALLRAASPWRWPRALRARQW